MILYLMRHGKSGSLGAGLPAVLTSRGEKDAAKIGKLLKKKKITPLTLWHSPLPRAVQTAGIIQDVLKLPPEAVEEKGDLIPEGSAAEMVRKIHKSQGDLMLVSHLPFLRSLTSHFFDSGEEPEELDFPTAGVCALEIGKGRAKLLWALCPSDL